MIDYNNGWYDFYFENKEIIFETYFGSLNLISATNI